MKWIVLYPALAFRLRQHARSGMHSVPLFTTDICMGMPLQTSCALFKLQKVNTYCDSNKDDPDCEDIRQCVPAECNFGHCVNGHCRCNPGYSGVQCDVPPSVVPTETLTSESASGFLPFLFIRVVRRTNRDLSIPDHRGTGEALDRHSLCARQRHGYIASKRDTPSDICVVPNIVG
eukprot:GEMP01076795.1.p1 GENE.GEMP01076795.1~~GEMP01076795.1.p1  ORF type:complete len:176 (+),score=32.05 GEMP01076795.1:185-712(+)